MKSFRKRLTLRRPALDYDEPITGTAASASSLRAGPRRLTLIAYGGLAMPLVLAEAPITLYLPAFYAQELGLAVGLLGLVFLIARLCDGLFDVFIGWLSDRTVSRFGRRKPWIALGAPLLAVATWFLCNPPANADLLYLGIWVTLFYVAHTAIRIPYLSWGSELSADYQQRSRVTAYREVFTMVGSLLFAAGPVLFLAEDASLGRVLMLISIITLAMLALTTLPITLRVPDMPSTERVLASLGDVFRVLFKDKVLQLFAAAWLIYWTGQGVVNSLAVFSFNAGLGLPDKIFWSILILYVSMLCSVPITMALAKRFDKHVLLAVGMVVNGACVSALVIVPSHSFGIVAVIWMLTGVGVNVCLYLPPSIMADIIDHGEANSDARLPGAYMGVFNVVVKAGFALGIGVAFGLLEVVGFKPTAEIFSVQDKLNIRLLGFGLPGLLMIAAGILITRFPISRAKHAELRAVLERRAKSTPL